METEVRKPPIKHDVKAHTREGRPVQSFTRGSGEKRVKRKKVVVGGKKDYEIVPIGDCYGYVFKMALKGIVEDDKGFKIVHATVEEPFAQPPRSYTHAWIEREGRVHDWQTMVMGTSKFAGEGWPKDLFYKTFKPRETREYTPKQVVEYTNKFGHTGPWRD